MRRVLFRTTSSAVLGAWVALLADAQPARAQEGAVVGTVLAERSLRPVAGAQVVVEGDGARQALTDADGRFRLTGLAGAEVTLAVRRIGFRPLQQTVRVGATDLRLTLSEVAVELNDVVVTGTAEATERRALGNAVTTVSAPEVMERGSVGSVHQLLNGRAPGVVVEPGSGVVGGGGRITVRGGTSFSLGNEPLLYVDGVRVNNAPATGPVSQGPGAGVISRINDLDPDDIERVEIIKGPAAATLYGTEASGGVINVITRQGAAGPPRWTLGIKLGTNYLRDPEGRFPTNYALDSAGNVISLDLMARENARGTPIFRRGSLQDYHLSVGGGIAQLRYYLAGGYEASNGVDSWNELRKHSARMNLELVPSDKLTLGASVDYAGGPTRVSPEGVQGQGGRLRSTLLADPRNLPGGGGDSTRRGFAAVLPEEYDLLASRGGKFEQQLDRLTTDLRVQHRPFHWLSQRLSAGFDRAAAANTTFFPRVDALIAKPPFGSFPRGYKEIAEHDVTYQTVDYAATASAGVTPALRSSTSVGGQYYHRAEVHTFVSGAEFPVEGLSSISSTKADTRVSQEEFLENVTIGLFAQEQVAWRDRLFVTAALRADDNSAFGDEFDRVYYPKASVSWVASEEPFFHAGWVNTLRLRAAYGEAGRQPSSFDALRTYALATGPGDVLAVTPQSLGNPNLGPERGKELELGFDAGFFGDRLALELTYYDKRTVDAILTREVAPSTGYPGVQLFNAGEVRNTGVEILTRAVPLRGRRWAWELSLTLATNDNKVVSLGDAGLQFVSVSDYLGYRVGYPVGSWFEKRVVSAAMDATGAVSDVRCDDGRGGSTPCAGADGVYGTADDAPAVYLGRTIPKVQGALGSTVALLGRRLRLYALVDVKTGYRKFDFETFARCTNFARCRENYFPTEFDPRRIASITAGKNLVDYAIVDASFAKLRELSATYALPDRWAAVLGASRATVSLAGRELHTWTRYSGLDPEAMLRAGARAGTYGNWEQFVTPQLSQWAVAITLGY